MNRCRSLGRTCAFAAVVTCAGSVTAQGTRADYERAAAVNSRFAGRLFGDVQDVEWADDSSVLRFRRRRADRGFDAFVVDPRAGVLERDGASETVAAIAGELARALARDVAVERAESASDGRRRLWERDTAVVWSWREGEAEAVREAIASVPAWHAPRAGAHDARSGGSSRETHVVFVHDGVDDEVELVWIDPDGRATSYGSLGPGEVRRQHTFVGHVWALRRDGTLGERVRATRAPSAVVVSTTTFVDPDARRRVATARRRRARGGAPDGSMRVSFRDHDVVLTRADDSMSELTEDGTAADGFGGRVWWSPDSKRFVVLRTRAGSDRRVHYVESSPDDQLQPKLRSYGYRKPGDAIPLARPWLFDAATGVGHAVDDARFPNPWRLSEFAWRGDSRSFSFLYNQRGHDVLRVVAVDVADDGATATRTIVDEVADTFVDYANKQFLHRVRGSGELIWMSERDGWNHLYRYGGDAPADGAPITRGPWVVRGVDRVDDEARRIWFRACGIHADQDPYHVHYAAVDFDGSNLVVLTDGDGSHRLSWSPDRAWFVDTWSRVDQPPVVELRAADGTFVCELARGDDSALRELGWQPPQRFVAKGRDGATDIWGVLHRPTSFDPNRRYPVIESIYAGPHGAFVPKTFRATRRQSELAELGFVVVQIDGMGTNWRSKAFHDVAWKNLGDSGFPDRIAWLRAAAVAHPELDLTRVGIYGGSAGGQSALRALLAHGDFYDAAVADCGCHDNRVDKIWWNELWMGWPIGPHYEAQSNVTNAHKLEGDLLLTVGEADRNVDPASTMQVVDALIDADKDFDLVVFPGGGHGSGESTYGRRRRQDFFVRHLLDVEPRHEPGPSALVERFAPKTMLERHRGAFDATRQTWAHTRMLVTPPGWHIARFRIDGDIAEADLDASIARIRGELMLALELADVDSDHIWRDASEVAEFVAERVLGGPDGDAEKEICGPVRGSAVTYRWAGRDGGIAVLAAPIELGGERLWRLAGAVHEAAGRAPDR